MTNVLSQPILVYQLFKFKNHFIETTTVNNYGSASTPPRLKQLQPLKLASH